MRWQDAFGVVPTVTMPGGYRLEVACRDSISGFSTALARWYPDVTVGAESVHLKPTFLASHVQFADDKEPRSMLALAARHNVDELAAVITLEKNDEALTITSRLGAVAPEHRGAGIANVGPMIVEAIGRAIGAELAWYFVTMKIPHQQRAAERAGFRLVGIIPGYDRDMVRPGEVRRVYEAIYAKLLVPESSLERPSLDAMTPKTQAVWRALFDTPS